MESEPTWSLKSTNGSPPRNGSEVLWLAQHPHSSSSSVRLLNVIVAD